MRPGAVNSFCEKAESVKSGLLSAKVVCLGRVVVSLGSLKTPVSVCRRSANLLCSRPPFSCASIIGSVTHPVGDRLLVPADNRRPVLRVQPR
jgi:hypothetical protein